MTDTYPFDAEMRWNIDRYVLGDETLDSELFEACMLEDEELAWAVADRIAQLQELAVVLRQPAMESSGDAVTPAKMQSAGNFRIPETAARSPVGSLARKCLGMAAVAASLFLIGFGLKTMLPVNRQPAESVSSLTNDELVVVATTWMALQDDELEAVDEWQASATLDMQNAMLESQPDDEDWLLDAASVFFEQTATGEDS